MKTFQRFLTVSAAVFVLVGCSEDQELSQLQEGTESPSLMEGTIDQEMSWTSGVVVQMNVKAPVGSTVKAYSIGQERKTVFAQKVIEGNDVLVFDVPLATGGNLHAFGMECVDTKGNSTFQQIAFDGKPYQVGRADFSEVPVAANGRAYEKSSGARAVSRSADPSLYGKAVTTPSGYSEFPAWILRDISQAIPEEQDPKANGQVYDYELYSNGPFYVSMIYGYTGSPGPRVLGYYYHPKGEITNIKFVNLTETLLYDYLDNYAKTQYRIGNNWYDANYWYTDGEGVLKNENGSLVKASNKRLGDGIYNIFLAYNNQDVIGTIEGVRGLSFKVDAPVGYAVGFYLLTNSTSADQKNMLVNKGFDMNRFPDSFFPGGNRSGAMYSVNFSNMALNYSSGTRPKYKSAIKRYDGFTFMGIDDGVNSGKSDCNDVSFALLKGKDGSEVSLLPKIFDLQKEQYYNPDGTFTDTPKDEEEIQAQNWTFGFENAGSGSKSDFDMNDIVIGVNPGLDGKTVDIYLKAVGAVEDTDLYYDGERLGEVHALMGVGKGEYANTIEGAASIPERWIKTVVLPDGKTALEARDKFYIICSDGRRVSALTPTGKTPEAICVAGDWQWPRERVNVIAAYPKLGQHALNIHKVDYWGWYLEPLMEKVVGHFTGNNHNNGK